MRLCGSSIRAFTSEARTENARKRKTEGILHRTRFGDTQGCLWGLRAAALTPTTRGAPDELPRPRVVDAVFPARLLLVSFLLFVGHGSNETNKPV